MIKIYAKFMDKTQLELRRSGLGWVQSVLSLNHNPTYFLYCGYFNKTVFD